MTATPTISPARTGPLDRFLNGAGIGTVASMMVPFSITLIIVWTLFLLLFWALGIPLGVQSAYGYP